MQTAKTRQLSPNHWQALSSTGTSVYDIIVTPAGTSCTCPAGSNGRRCYHVATILSREVVSVAAPKAWNRRPAAHISDLYA